MPAWYAVGCFTKPRNHRQISTGSIYFFDPGGYPCKRSGCPVSGLMLFAAKPVFAEEQLRIFRLRFTALRMTAAFLFCEKLYVPSVGCFTKPRNHRQISTGSIYFFRPGGYPSPSDSGWPGSSRPWIFPCIYRAPFGVNDLQTVEIYFAAAQHLPRRASVGHRVDDVVYPDLRTESRVLDRVSRIVEILP